MSFYLSITLELLTHVAKIYIYSYTLGSVQDCTHFLSYPVAESKFLTKRQDVCSDSCLHMSYCQT